MEKQKNENISFKIGDRVKRKKSECEDIWERYCKKDFKPLQDPEGIFEVENVERTGEIRLKYNLDGFYYNPINFELVEQSEFKSSEFPKTPENKMDIETLKTFSPKNLVEGKKQAEEEKANYEASESKKFYVNSMNEKESQERIIRIANEELKEINKKLGVFKSK